MFFNHTLYGSLLTYNKSPIFVATVLASRNISSHLASCSSIVAVEETAMAINMTHEQNIPAPSPAQGVGPTYRRDDEKPTATVSKEVSYENVHILPQTPQLIALLT